MAKKATLSVAVIGAGPIGLEAALACLHAGHTVTLFDRGDIGESVRYWRHATMFTPFAWNATTLGLAELRREDPKTPLPDPQEFLTANDFLERYLEPLAMTSRLSESLRTKTDVTAIGRGDSLKADGAGDPHRASQPFRVMTRDDKGNESVEEFDRVLDCSGTHQRHAWAGGGGIPAIGETAAEKLIAYGLEDVGGAKQAAYANKTIAVIGGGDSAATTVTALACLAESHISTWVVWLSRGRRSAPLPRVANDPLRERDRLAARANSLASRGDGNLEHHGQAFVTHLVSHGQNKGFRVEARIAGKPTTWEVDQVIANVGYLPNFVPLRELHVSEAELDGSGATPEPGFFVLGAKSLGRDGRFLLRDGHLQIERVVRNLG